MIVSDYDVRIALINAVLRDVATRQDVLELRNGISSVQNELKSYVDQRIGEVSKRIEDVDSRINDVNSRINDLNSRIADLNSLVRASLVAIVVMLATTILVPLLLKLFA